MKIVYRLAGLDGEATEDRIDSIVDEEDDEKDPETKYKICRILTEDINIGDKTVNGVLLILDAFKKIEYN